MIFVLMVINHVDDIVRTKIIGQYSLLGIQTPLYLDIYNQNLTVLFLQLLSCG